MAEHYPAPSQAIDPLELTINSHFDRIIGKANVRRFEILTELREKREESRARDTQREEMISQIAAAKSQVESVLKENPLKQMQQKMINEMEKELEKLKMTPQKKELQFSIGSNSVEQAIEEMGNISEVTRVYFDAFQPVTAVANAGKGPGELDCPTGVAVEERSGNIFVAEYSNSRVSVFSQTGEYIMSFGTVFQNPLGIAIQNDNLYVSDWNIHSVFHFKLPDMKLIQRVGKKGSGNLQFEYPRQLFISQVGDVYVCDTYNDRIQVLTSNIKFKKIFKHHSMTCPADIKFTAELLYVLSYVDNPCLHVFTLTGDKIRSILSRGESLQLTKPLFFCIDMNANIVVSDCGDHSIKIFTPEGEFLHRIGRQGHEKGMFFHPRGISFTKEGRLICVSDNENFSLQMFS